MTKKRNKKEIGIKIKHNKKLLFLILILLVLLVFTVFMINKKEGIKKKKECLSDEDCIKQQITCCPCSMGGEEKCVSKEEAVYLRRKIEECDKDIFCIASYNCREFNCACEEGKCVEKKA